jgi:dihydroorotase
MKSILIRNSSLVNEGSIFKADVLIENGLISRIEKNGLSRSADVEIEGEGQYLIPGLIDDQVHFREPGLTHKANINSESRAAVAGGVTSYMEMPNTVPNALTQELLEDKHRIAAGTSAGNYSFYMGAGNNNIGELLKTDPHNVCGIKIFMGSSTGNMLVDDEKVLERIFSECRMLIATHCEDEGTIRRNLELYKEKYGENIPFSAHPEIRSSEACYKSSSFAVQLAKKHGTRLHILHISTAEEPGLFDNTIPLKDKKITSEVCVHHLYFNSSDYERLGSLIKCNPAIKSENDRKALWKALLDDRLDVIATDHAPHTLQEKQAGYLQAPSGLPLVQHSLAVMLEFYKKGQISLERVVEKMCHAPAICFRIKKRGYIREGYWADLALVDLAMEDSQPIFYKCGWTPFKGVKFSSSVTHTIVSGHLAYREGVFDESRQGRRMEFDPL